MVMPWLVMKTARMLAWLEVNFLPKQEENHTPTCPLSL